LEDLAYNHISNNNQDIQFNNHSKQTLEQLRTREERIKLKNLELIA